MQYILMYIFVIVLTNLGFAYVPPIDVGFGLFSPMAISAGAVFVARDYAQRHGGKMILPAMLFGCILSYIMADPYIALASMLSFAVSEFIDYVIYTATHKPFHKRVLISTSIAAPIDTCIFLGMIGILTPANFILMLLCKVSASVVIYQWGQYKETNQPLIN